jgi:hypothetical protein
MSRRTVAVAVLALTLVCVVSLAQVRIPLRTPRIWTASSDVVNAAEAISTYSARKASINAVLAAARKEFWAAYPAGAEIEIRRKAYSEALTRKDLFNADVEHQISSRTPVSAELIQRFSAMIGLTEAVSGVSVEETHEFARAEFRQWSSALFGARKSDGSLTAHALEAAAAEYEAYTAKRDFAEDVRFNPRNPLNVPTSPPVVWTAWATAAMGGQSLEQAEQEAIALREAVGAAVFDNHVRVIRSYAAPADFGAPAAAGPPLTLIAHLTGHKPHPRYANPNPDVFFQLAQIDEAVFRLRSALAGLGEEPALDRIRELMFRGYLAFDDEAVATADREGQALRGRVAPVVDDLLRSVNVSDFAPIEWESIRFNPEDARESRSRVSDEWRIRAGLAKGEARPSIEPAGMKADIAKEMAIYRSAATRGTYVGCGVLTPERRTFVVDGLPEARMVISALDASYGIAPSVPGHQRLTVRLAAPGTCNTGAWAVVNLGEIERALATRKDVEEELRRRSFAGRRVLELRAWREGVRARPFGPFDPGSVKPSFVDGTGSRYDSAPDGFTPPIPENVPQWEVRMEAKTGNFVLSHVALRPIDKNIKESLLNQAALFLDYRRRESAATFDEDWALLEALEPQPKILSCQYRVDQRPTYQFYWYRTAPARFSDPAYLESRLPNHPLLTIGRPQSVCPARVVDLAGK